MKGACSQQYFVRNQPDLCHLMERTKIKQPQEQQPGSSLAMATAEDLSRRRQLLMKYPPTSPRPASSLKATNALISPLQPELRQSFFLSPAASEIAASTVRQTPLTVIPSAVRLTPEQLIQQAMDITSKTPGQANYMAPSMPAAEGVTSAALPGTLEEILLQFSPEQRHEALATLQQMSPPSFSSPSAALSPSTAALLLQQHSNLSASATTSSAGDPSTTALLDLILQELGAAQLRKSLAAAAAVREQEQLLQQQQRQNGAALANAVRELAEALVKNHNNSNHGGNPFSGF